MQTIFRRSALLAAALLATAVVVSGCFRESDGNTNEGTNPSPGEIVVEVNITDETIQMPDEIESGPVLFEVTNSGTAPHGFAIEGVAEQIDDLLTDGLETLRTELEPGTYVVYSPVEGDREAGLERELTVTEAEAESPNPVDGGVGPSEEQDPIEDDGN